MGKNYDKVKKWRENNPEKYRAQKKREYDMRFCKRHGVLYEDYIQDREGWKIKVGVRLSKEDKLKQKIVEKIREKCKKNGIPFDITRDDFMLPTHCKYLGIKLNYPNKKTYHPANYSVDKIIPELGYVKGNIQIISLRANAMKSDASLGELITFAQNILKEHKKSS